MDIFKDKTVLITGGTGSFGQGFTEYLLKNTRAKKIIIFSRDEYKQGVMESNFKDERLRFFIGDIRDLQRLQRAFNGVDIVIHAAALKQVPALEYNPSEAVKTNVLGSQNVINASIDQGVKKVILVSTDKAAEPINLYGATKLCAEKLFVASNVISAGSTKFGVVRYGNVLGSRGSIVDILLNKEDKNKVQITDMDMTRFWITLKQSFRLVSFALENLVGGEIFVPKIPSMKITNLFSVIKPGAKQEVVGIRPGEKLHEILLTEDESRGSFELEDYYVILPKGEQEKKPGFDKYKKKGKKLKSRFSFSSDTNKDWMTPSNLKSIVSELKD